MMPALSSTMTEGKISQWLINVGDKVEVGDMVLVVESDKADMDVESYEEGYLAAILTPEGESAAVGSPVRFPSGTLASIPPASLAWPSRLAHSSSQCSPCVVLECRSASWWLMRPMWQRWLQLALLPLALLPPQRHQVPQLPPHPQ